MILFIITLGNAIQCTAQLGCVPVPMEAVQELIKLGVIELVLETGIYSYYRKKYKKEQD